MIMCVLLCYPVSIRIYYQQGGLFLVLLIVIIVVDSLGMCGLKTACPSGQVPYYLQTGVGRQGHPTICWNGQ